MRSGTVKMWNEKKGYGFLKPDDRGDDVFVHVTALPEGHEYLSEGDKVSFEEEISRRTNKNQAVNVQVEGS